MTCRTRADPARHGPLRGRGQARGDRGRDPPVPRPAGRRRPDDGLDGSVMNRTDQESPARLVSVNVGRVRTLTLGERPVRTAIGKAPIEGLVRLRGVNLDGDDQADRSVHGGPDKAVYAYAAEDFEWWTGKMSRRLGPGMFGENLTTSGSISAPRSSASGGRSGRRSSRSASPGAPATSSGSGWGIHGSRQVRRGRSARPVPAHRGAGRPARGRPIRVLSRPDHGVTIGLVTRAYHMDHRLAARLLTRRSSRSPGPTGRAT